MINDTPFCKFGRTCFDWCLDFPNSRVKDGKKSEYSPYDGAAQHPSAPVVFTVCLTGKGLTRLLLMIFRSRRIVLCQLRVKTW